MGNVVDLSDVELLKTGSDILVKSLTTVCQALCCICFDTGTYINYGTASTGKDITQGTLEDLKIPFSTIVDKMTAPADRDVVREFLDLDTLQERLSDHQVISTTCRNSEGNWTSAQFIVAQRTPDGSPSQVLYTSGSLRIQKQEDTLDVIAKREGFLDPTTGLLNRAGYNQLLAEAASKTGPVAYAVIDVDNLKGINDTYGHPAGDNVLLQVADVIRSLIRKGDYAARVGDDEFAIILNGCPLSAADRIIAKFETLHQALSEALPDGKPATLSVGACFAPNGLTAKVTEYAENAMYSAKAEGRGGCALADQTGTVVQKWFDHSISRHYNVEFVNTVGSWKIEMPADGSARRMFCDDAMLRFAGEKRRINPEDVYRHWRQGLSDADSAAIDAAIKKLSSGQDVAYTSFDWKTNDGETFSVVSSVALDRTYQDGRCIYGYFDFSRTKDAHKRESEIEMLNEALARSLVFGYVLDLEAGTYMTLRQPSSGPLSFIRSDGPTVSLESTLMRIAADEEGAQALRNLLDRETMSSRLAGIDHVFCDFLSTGVHGWCRAKLYTFKAGGFDGLEKVILVGESIEVNNPEDIDFTLLPAKDTTDKQGKILVVDDDELNRVILDEALSGIFDVVHASDGVQAYETIKQQPHAFAGIVTDLHMPNMNGEQLLQKLQEDRISDEVPVVVITAEDKSEAENRCLEHGAIDFIRKPFHVPVAQRRVNNVVSLFKYQNYLRFEVERRTEQLQRTCGELEDKTMWLREYAFRLSETSAHMIESLGEIVEFRSVETGNHVARVKHYTHALAQHLLETDPDCGLTPESVELITEASPLHDVGKIAIPDAVLLKPGRLTTEEFDVMKTHTTQGLKLLSSFDSIWDESYRATCEEICLCHHERYDGKGYPNGLKGEEIPLSAQIVSVADIFDALSSDRVYRPALSRAETYKLIMSGEVGSFSPRILKCFDETFPQLEEIAKRVEAEDL